MSATVQVLLSSVEPDAAPPTNPFIALLMETRATDARARLPHCSSVWDFRRLAAARLPELQAPLQLLVAIQARIGQQQPAALSAEHCSRQSWLLPRSLPMMLQTSRPHILGWHGCRAMEITQQRRVGVKQRKAPISGSCAVQRGVV